MSKVTIKGNTGNRNQEKNVLNEEVAVGGELHQVAGGDHAALTTNQGVPLADNQNSLKANPHGQKVSKTKDRVGSRGLRQN